MNKKKVLVITSSPRKKSNSKAAAQLLVTLIKKTSKHLISDEWTDINKVKIKHCEGCEECAEILKCRIKDAAAGLIKRIDESDIVIVASPVYFMGTPSRLKAFIDRNLVKWNGLNSKYGKNVYKIKKGVIILTAEVAGRDNFIGAENEIRSMFAVNKVKTAAVIKFSRMQMQGSFADNAKAQAAIKKTASLL